MKSRKYLENHNIIRQDLVDWHPFLCDHLALRRGDLMKFVATTASKILLLFASFISILLCNCTDPPPPPAMGMLILGLAQFVPLEVPCFLEAKMKRCRD